MNDDIFQRRRALIWQLLRDHLEAHGILTVDGIHLFGLAGKVVNMPGLAGILSAPVTFIGCADAYASDAMQGTLRLSVPMPGLANTAEQTNPADGGLSLSVAANSNAVSNRSANRDGVIAFRVDVNGNAKNAVHTAPSDGSIALLVNLNGTAVANDAQFREGLLEILAVADGTANLAEQVKDAEYAFIVYSPVMDATADTTEADGMAGALDTVTMASNKAVITVDSYTVEVNEAGGLTYTINASEYTMDGQTLKVW